MICARSLVAIVLLLIVPTFSFATQKRRRKPVTPKAAPAPVQKPNTLAGCGVSLRVPPGWEVSVAKKRELKEAQVTAAPLPDANANPSADDTKLPGQTADETPVEMPPCSFVLSPKAPSALVKNTESTGPVGEMELRVVDGDLETAAANILQKDEKGWFAQDSKGSRSDAKLTKQKTMQILTAVIVERCYEKSGKYRGLCETSKYVYSNGKKNLLVTAGPYLGETEYSVLNSVRFTGTTGTAARKRTTR